MEYKYLYKNGQFIKHLPLNESEQPKKGKLFIPRRSDEKKLESERIKNTLIAEIKEIIEEEGSIDIGELDGVSIHYWTDDMGDKMGFITEFHENYILVDIFEHFLGGYIESIKIKYNYLNLKQIMEIRDALETYQD